VVFSDTPTAVSRSLTQTTTPTRTSLPAPPGVIIIIITLHGLPHVHAADQALHAALRAAILIVIPHALQVRLHRLDALSGARLYDDGTSRRLQSSGGSTAGVTGTLHVTLRDQAAAVSTLTQVTNNASGVASGVVAAVASAATLSPNLRALFASNVTAVVAPPTMLDATEGVAPPPLPLGAIVGGAAVSLAFIAVAAVGVWCRRTGRCGGASHAAHKHGEDPQPDGADDAGSTKDGGEGGGVMMSNPLRAGGRDASKRIMYAPTKAARNSTAAESV
jgi:hypothetical protein